MYGLVDLDVVDKAKNGEKISTDEIFCHFRKYIDYLSFKTLKNAGIEQVSGLKEDCMQHVCMRLMKTIKRFDPDYQK